MKNSCYVILLITLLFLPVGCGKNLPTGMPSLVPCSIMLTQENAPLAGASVTLYSEEPDLANWSVCGISDQSGVVTLRTHGQYTGAPLGHYTVVVSKSEEVANGTAKDMGGVMVEPPKTVYQLVEKKYSAKETSPLKLTIEKGMKKTTLDVGKKTHDKVTKSDMLPI